MAGGAVDLRFSALRRLTAWLAMLARRGWGAIVSSPPALSRHDGGTELEDNNLSLSTPEASPDGVDRLLGLFKLISRQHEEPVILIAAADAETRGIARQMIEHAGLTAAEVANGRRALDWLVGNPAPALIVLDQPMPDFDGSEFLIRLRDDAKLRQILVVLVTNKTVVTNQLLPNDRVALTLSRGVLEETLRRG